MIDQLWLCRRFKLKGAFKMKFQLFSKKAREGRSSTAAASAPSTERETRLWEYAEEER